MDRGTSFADTRGRRFEALVREAKLDCEFQAQGTLNVYRDARAFDHSRELALLPAEFGLPVEMLDGAACRAREPALNDSIVGGYFHAGDAQLRPERYCAELARDAGETATANGTCSENVSRASESLSPKP